MMVFVASRYLDLMFQMSVLTFSPLIGDLSSTIYLEITTESGFRLPCGITSLHLSAS